MATTEAAAAASPDDDSTANETEQSREEEEEGKGQQEQSNDGENGGEVKESSTADNDDEAVEDEHNPRIPNMSTDVFANLQKYPLKYPVSTIPFAELEWEIPRWKELQRKRLALIHQRVRLEKRLFEFEARNARIVENVNGSKKSSSEKNERSKYSDSVYSQGSNTFHNSDEKSESGSTTLNEAESNDGDDEDNMSMSSVSSSAWRLGRFRRRRKEKKTSKTGSSLRSSTTSSTASTSSASSKSSFKPFFGRKSASARFGGGGGGFPGKNNLKHQYSMNDINYNEDENDEDDEDDDEEDADGERLIDYPEVLYQRSSTETIRWTGPVNEASQPDGFGRMVFSDGQVYIGYVEAGQRKGQGKNSWPIPKSQQQKLRERAEKGRARGPYSRDDDSDPSEEEELGQWYTGEWQEDSRWGRGTHRWPDGRSVTGQWQEGHLHGHIFYCWPDGSTYDGDAHNGKKHGRGTHSYSDGRVYTGLYKSGREHGHGSLTEADQTKYRGQFHHGQRHGYGIQIWKEKTYDGAWQNNIAHGRGKLTWRNGACYSGDFKRGKYHGKGSYRDERGRQFVGYWQYGIREGPGQQFWPAGQSYTGDFYRGSRHGYGKLKELDGSLYAGGWAGGERSGLGVQRVDDGTLSHVGLWRQGMPYEDPQDEEDSERKKGTVQDDLALLHVGSATRNALRFISPHRGNRMERLGEYTMAAFSTAFSIDHQDDIDHDVMDDDGTFSHRLLLLRRTVSESKVQTV